VRDMWREWQQHAIFGKLVRYLQFVEYGALTRCGWGKAASRPGHRPAGRPRSCRRGKHEHHVRLQHADRART
jgi:hypothetical protein